MKSKRDYKAIMRLHTLYNDALERVEGGVKFRDRWSDDRVAEAAGVTTHVAVVFRKEVFGKLLRSASARVTASTRLEQRVAELEARVARLEAGTPEAIRRRFISNEVESGGVSAGTAE